MSANVAKCPSCGAAAGPEDDFCGDCGTRLSRAPAPRAEAPAAKPRVKRRKTKRKWVIRGLLLAALLGAGWFLFLRPVSYSPPSRTEPELPQALAGTMREFPVDTDPSDPARLTSVVSQSFPAGRESDGISVPQQQLPPGVAPQDLPRYGAGVTSGQYHTAGTKDPVNVHVIDTGRNSATTMGRQITQAVSGATGGDRTGIQVDSPRGTSYRGERIRTGQTVIYILINQHSSTVVIVYAPTPAAQPVAERLSRNVGNSRGVVDQPGMRGTLWTLPRDLPLGFVLEGTLVITRADLGLDPGMLASEGPGGIDPEVRDFIKLIKGLLPERLVSARYRDELGSSWDVLVYDVASVRKAQNLWWLLNWTIGFKMTGVQVSGVGGLTLEVEEGQILLFHKGPYLVALMAPPNTTMEMILLFAESLQI